MALCPACHRTVPAEIGPSPCPHCGATGPDPIVGTRIGHYEVLARLAEGGMGIIYKARQHPINRLVALKFIQQGKEADAGDRAKRFLREAERASLLVSPHAVRIYDFGQTEGGALFMAMELIEGERLKDAIARAGVLPERTAIQIALQVCEVLREAHDRGVIHRDLKPANIMVQPERAGVRNFVTVLDFGIAKAMGEESGTITDSGLVLGTPQYMSPEQCQGGKVDARSDIYSLGVVMFEMLAGSPPFSSASGSLASILVKHLSEPPPAIGAVNQWVKTSADLEKLVHRALAKLPGQRFADVRELMRGLEGLIENPAAPAPGRRPTAVREATPAPGRPVRPGRTASPAHAGAAKARDPERRGGLLGRTMAAGLLVALAGVGYAGWTAMQRRSIATTARVAMERARAEAEESCRRGEDGLARGDLAGARTAYQAAIEKDRTLPLPHLGLARIALALGKLDEADFHYGTCIEKARASLGFALAAEEAARGRSNLARITDLTRRSADLSEKGGCAQAMPLLGEVLALAPGNVRAHLDMARCEAEAGNREAACTHIEAALLTGPADGTSRPLARRLGCPSPGGSGPGGDP